MKLNSSTIWLRLQNRLGLVSDGVLDGKRIADIIVPVTSVDELVQKQGFQYVSKNLTAGAAVYVEYMAPAKGKRWKLSHIHREATIAITAVCVVPGPDIAENTCLWTVNATAASIHDMHGQIVEYGGSIGMKATGDVGDTAIFLAVWYIEEDVG